MNKKHIIIAAVLLVILGVAAYNMTSAPKKGGTAVSDITEEALDFTLSDLEGNSVTLSSFKGKVVFLNFWATWCPPCCSEMPSMQKLHDKMKDKDFAMLAVDVGERKAGVAAFVDKNNYKFTVLLDSEHKVSSDYKVAGIPTTLIIDKEGKVVLREVGSRDWDSSDIIEKISSLLK